MHNRLPGEEVTDLVSALKKDYSQPHLRGAEDDDQVVLSNATFKWNEVTEHVGNDRDKGKSNSGSPLTESSEAGESATAVGDSVSERSADENGERVFELRDISVIFPPSEFDCGHRTHSIW
jgi:hypothetical protein